MKQLNLDLIMAELVQFSKDRDWDQFHSVKNLTMALSVETSELVEIFQWLSEEDSNQVKNNSQLKPRAEEEIADVFIYLLRIAHKLDINVEDAIKNKIKKNALKYPVELSKGNSKKYNEF
jgi:dCTP diphosphatase